MHRRILAASLVVAAAVFAACSDKPLPTAPQASGGPALQSTISRDGCVEQPIFTTGTDPIGWFTQTDPRVTTLINTLWGAHTDNKQAALSTWENLKKDKLEGRPIQSHVDNFGKFTVNQYTGGFLTDPGFTLAAEGGLTLTTGVVRLLDLVFTCVGLVPTSLPEPPEGFDAAFEILEPSDDPNGQQVNTSSNDAGSFVPPGALKARSMLVMVRQNQKPEDPKVKVNTPFPELSHTVDVALAGGGLHPNKKITVLVCPRVIPGFDYSRLVIAHQKDPVSESAPLGEGVEYLPPPEGGHLTCDDSHASASWREQKGFLRQRAMQFAQLAKKAWRLVGPKPLYAGHAAIGGGGFGSPVVVVDPYVQTGITDVDIPETTYGEPVAVTAMLRITGIPSAQYAMSENPPAALAWVGQPVTQSLAGMPFLTLSEIEMTATLDDGKTQTDAIDEAGAFRFSFDHVNAGDEHNAQLSFALTMNQVPPGAAVFANVPIFAATSDNENAFVVRRAPLDIQPADASRVYGADDPALTGEVTGEVYDENNKIIATYETDAVRESYITTSTRTYQTKVKTVSELAGSGVLLSNYIFDVNEHVGVFTITKRTLTGSAASASRDYGEPNPAFSGAPVNLVSFDDGLQVLYENTSVATTSAGPASPIAAEYSITARLDGAPVENYVNSIAAGTLTINPRVLTGGLTDPAPSIVYGDEVPATFPGTLNALVGGVTKPALVEGDGVSASFVTNPSAAQGSPVGNYGIVLSLTGPAASNYNAEGVSGGTLIIAKRPLTVVADNASRDYGDANPGFSGVVGNAFAGDGLVVTYSSAATATTAAGPPAGAIPSEYLIVPALSGPPVGNYDATLTNGILTIKQAPLDIGANSFSRDYGDANPSFTGSAVGVKNGESVGVLASLSTPVTALSPVGDYVLVPFLAAAYPNYYVRNSTNGKLTITKRALTGTIDDKEKVEGEANPPLTGSVTNTVAGDGFVVSYKTTATQSSTPGDYPITVDLTGAGGSNYSWNTANDGTLTVTAVPIPVGSTSIRLVSDAGDFVGQGKTYEYTKANAVITGTPNTRHFRIAIRGDEQWTGDFEVPNTVPNLQVGSYTGLERYPFDAPNGGLNWSGEGRGCNTLSGSFKIDRALYVSGSLVAIDLSFEQFCGAATVALRGEIHWSANDPTLPPDPVSPVPAALWQPAAGSTPATGNFVYLNSEAGDFIGQGQTYTYPTFNVSVNGGHLTIGVSDAQTWTGNFQTMYTLSQLQSGYYPDVLRYPFHNPAKGGLHWSGNGRACNKLVGWFAFDRVTYTAGVVTGFDLRFEQRCQGSTGVLRGAIRWDAP